MVNSFYNFDELKTLGLNRYGDNVLISRNCSLYAPEKIILGDNVRIDDFCILSGVITVGDYVHISAGTYLYGGDMGIQIGDFSTISSRCAVYALSDDYSGNYMTNPMVPDELRDVFRSQVKIGEHVIIGAGCTILPGINIGEGCSIGAMSLVNKNLEPWAMYKGIPARRYKDRMKHVLEYENYISGGGINNFYGFISPRRRYIA